MRLFRANPFAATGRESAGHPSLADRCRLRLKKNDCFVTQHGDHLRRAMIVALADRPKLAMLSAKPIHAAGLIQP